MDDMIFNYTIRHACFRAACSIFGLLAVTRAEAQIVGDPPAAWIDTITINGQINAGVYANPDLRGGQINFGQLLTDHANQLQLNQLLLTVTRPVNTVKEDFDLGFNLQLLYGTDARFVHILGVTSNLLSERNQFAPVQANIVAHLPIFTALGMDLKAGIIGGAMGLETLDSSTRPFYSLSYISNFLLPFEHIGAISTIHLNENFDLYVGIDTGNQTSFGRYDNNRVAAGYLGFGLNALDDGKLSIIAISRIGPEDPGILYPNADRLMRYWNDVSVTYKATDRWTFLAEANYLYDEGFPAEAFGFSAYAGYVLTPNVTLNGRAEIYRDNRGTATFSLLSNTGWVRILAGLPTPTQTPPPTTYGEMTFGVTWKPDVPKPGPDLTIRAEVRYDRSLNGTRPFNNLRDRDAMMFGSDIIVKF